MHVRLYGIVRVVLPPLHDYNIYMSVCPYVCTHDFSELCLRVVQQQIIICFNIITFIYLQSINIYCLKASRKI